MSIIAGNKLIPHSKAWSIQQLKDAVKDNSLWNVYAYRRYAKYLSGKERDRAEMLIQEAKDKAA